MAKLLYGWAHLFALWDICAASASAGRRPAVPGASRRRGGSGGASRSGTAAPARPGCYSPSGARSMMTGASSCCSVTGLMSLAHHGDGTRCPEATTRCCKRSGARHDAPAPASGHRAHRRGGRGRRHPVRRARAGGGRIRPRDLPPTANGYLGVFTPSMPHSTAGLTGFESSTKTKLNVAVYYSGWLEPFQSQLRRASVRPRGGDAGADRPRGRQPGRNRRWKVRQLPERPTPGRSPDSATR